MVWRTFIRSSYTWLVLACLILSGLVLPPTFLKNIGFVYLVKGINHDNDARELSKTQAILESAQGWNAEAPGPVYGLTLASHHAGLEEQSLLWAEEGIRIAPNDPLMQLALADALDANGRSDEALAVWQESGATPLLKQRAESAENLQNWPMAEKWYALYLQLEPEDANSTIQLSMTYRRQNKLLQAEDVLLKYLTGTTGDNSVYHELGLVYIAQNKTAEAASAFFKAIELDSSDYWSTLYLSNIELVMNNLEQARKLSNRAIQLNPDYPAPYFNSGKIASSRQDWQNASDSIARAIKLALDWNKLGKTPAISPTELAKYYVELANVKIETGSLMQAREAATQAVALDPANQKARELLDRLK